MMKKIYIFICVIYCKFFTSIENIFFFKTIKKKDKSNLSQKGFEVINLNYKFIPKSFEKIININKHMTKEVVSASDIALLIDSIFKVSKLKDIITSKTGFEYSIDYLISYTTHIIPEHEEKKEIYANHWHTDKPFSENTLKIIIPLNFTNNYNGGIQILNIEQTKNFINKDLNYEEKKHFIMQSKPDCFLLFLPNKCFHKAGNPQIKEGRKQLMLQLNPSHKWLVNRNLYKKQFFKEPKFPFFNYLFDKKKLLEG
jgi:hypothetical protein